MHLHTQSQGTCTNSTMTPMKPYTGLIRCRRGSNSKLGLYLRDKAIPQSRECLHDGYVTTCMTLLRKQTKKKFCGWHKYGVTVHCTVTSQPNSSLQPKPNLTRSSLQTRSPSQESCRDLQSPQLARTLMYM